VLQLHCAAKILTSGAPLCLLYALHVVPDILSLPSWVVQTVFRGDRDAAAGTQSTWSPVMRCPFWQLAIAAASWWTPQSVFKPTTTTLRCSSFPWLTFPAPMWPFW